MGQEENGMDTETFAKAAEIIKGINLISKRIDTMEKNPGEIIYFTDVFLDDMQSRHKQEVVEVLVTRKTELEKELADL